MPLPADLTDIIRMEIRRALEGLHTAIPGRVVKYDPAKQTVDVELQIRLPTIGADGEVEWSDLPPSLPGVPLLVQGGGGYFVAVPLQAGDPVIVHATHADMSQWIYSGQGASEGPQTRLHGLGSTFAVAAVRPLPEVFADLSATELRLGKDGSDLQVRIDGTSINLGAATTSFVALADKVDQCMTALKTHVHATGAPGAPTLAPGVPPAGTTPLTLPATAASKVRAQ